MVVIYRITWLHYIESVSMDDMVSDNYQRLYSQHTTNQASGNGDIKNLISHIRTVQTKVITNCGRCYNMAKTILLSQGRPIVFTLSGIAFIIISDISIMLEPYLASFLFFTKADILVIIFDLM